MWRKTFNWLGVGCRLVLCHLPRQGLDKPGPNQNIGTRSICFQNVSLFAFNLWLKLLQEFKIHQPQTLWNIPQIQYFIKWILLHWFITLDYISPKRSFHLITRRYVWWDWLYSLINVTALPYELCNLTHVKMAPFI